MTEQHSTPMLHPKLALALVATLMVQTITALLWAGAASERLGQLERRADTTGELIERTARLEAQTIYMRETLERIERKLDESAP
ncbi:MAG: hypothetical protein MRY72_05720 [Aquisalinus sp.]|nr:hypothetical protein [Aquisalinus sp.]